jgi:hypothetical protein
MPRPRPSVLLVAALVAVALAGCGNKRSTVTEATTEGPYIDVGDLKYQVQISRLLNPFSREDRSLLLDVPPSQSLASGQQWFGVFLRVQNTTGGPLPMASRYQIVDTQGNVFRPIPVGPRNVFVFRPGSLGGDTVYPLDNTAAADSTTQGALLIFRIPNADLENRPLEFQVRSPRAPGEVGSVALDV